jgi:hypothetical protein
MYQAYNWSQVVYNQALKVFQVPSPQTNFANTLVQGLR